MKIVTYFFGLKKEGIIQWGDRKTEALLYPINMSEHDFDAVNSPCKQIGPSNQ